MKHIIIILLIFLFSTNTQSQTPVDSATMYLTGTFKAYNPQQAFQINLQNANNGNAKAMNAVAMQYTKGLGVDSNFNLAVYWFSQAATNNYTKALVNLGMLYKHKASDSAGYSLACQYFNQAVQAAEPSAYFAQGYMYYKGLGCIQSYTAALALFNQGIQINQSNCMYFKGLCYKFGYGVNQSADSANFYIDTAAKLGYKQANAEMANTNSTAAKHSTPKTKDQRLKTEDVFTHLPITTKPIHLNGTYNGLLNQYDYSGKQLLAQIPITLQVATNNNLINGSLQLNNQTIELQAIQQGNQLIFSQTEITSPKTNPQRLKTKLIFKTAQLALETKNDSSLLTGTLQLFNTYTHETEKPINIKLTQQVIAKNQADTKDQRPTPKNLAIFPNPTNGSFTMSFNLTKPSPVKIYIYNPQGKLVYTKRLEKLPIGKQNIPISFSNPPSEGREAGIYTATITTNLFTQSTAFIYEN